MSLTQLGHTLFDFLVSDFYVKQNPNPDIAFSKRSVPLEIGLQHISASG